MRSAVQSCVPLQESTAHRCVFFVYRHQAFPKGLEIAISDAESLLSKRQKWQWTEVSEANEGLMAARIKTSQGFPKRLSWVQCDRTERIRRSPSGDWNILGPAAWKSSTCETFVSAFLILGNTEGTPNLLIAFNFHYFHKWLVGRSEWVFIYEFPFVRNLHSSVFQVPPPQVPGSITRANPHYHPQPF